MKGRVPFGLRGELREEEDGEVGRGVEYSETAKGGRKRGKRKVSLEVSVDNYRDRIRSSIVDKTAEGSSDESSSELKGKGDRVSS